MAGVTATELRSRVAEILRRAEGGEQITITVRGRPIAALMPLTRGSRRPLTKAEMIGLLQDNQSDAGLRADLGRLAGDTTDDLGPISDSDTR
jgi:prevent-host-death family protein